MCSLTLSKRLRRVQAHTCIHRGGSSTMRAHLQRSTAASTSRFTMRPCSSERTNASTDLKLPASCWDSTVPLPCVAACVLCTATAHWCGNFQHLLAHSLQIFRLPYWFARSAGCTGSDSTVQQLSSLQTGYHTRAADDRFANTNQMWCAHGLTDS